MLQESLAIQPIQKKLRPARNGRPIAFPESKAMAYAGINVQLRRHANLLEIKIEFRKAARYIRPVIFTARQKSRRSLLGDLQIVRNGRINERLKRRLGTFALDWVDRVRSTVVIMRAGKRRDFSTCRKTHH